MSVLKLDGINRYIINGGQISNHTVINNDQGDTALKFLLEHSSPDAFHNSRSRNSPPRCLPGTRTSVLTRILEALNKTAEGSEWLFRLSGAPGMGKTAIAQTITETLYHTQRLAAAFFAWRNHQNHTFVTTIAYQLTQNIPVIQPYIKDAIERNPAVFHLSLHEQAKTLILDPFRQLQQTQPEMDASALPHVIVIDGLDHFNDSDWKPALNVLLQLLHERETFPFTILVTGRSSRSSYYDIEWWFHNCSKSHLLYPISNQDFNAKYADILTFVNHEMDDIKQSHPLKHLLPDDWPSARDKSNIVCRSEGLFVNVITIIQYIRSAKYVPSDRLDAALSDQGPLGKYMPSGSSPANPKTFLRLQAYTMPDEHRSFLEYDHQAYLNKFLEEMKAQDSPVAACPSYEPTWSLPFSPLLHPSALPDSSPFEVLSASNSPFQVIDNLQGTPLFELVQPSSEFSSPFQKCERVDF